MSDAVVGVTQGVSPDRLVDNESLTVGTNTVYRQRIEVAGAAAAEVARVENSAPAAGDYGLVVRSVGNNATTAADGSNVAIGTTTDTSSALTVIGRLKALVAQLPATLGRTTMANSLSVAIASDQANLGMNNAQVSGTAIDVNTGLATAGTQRVVLATPTTVLAGYQSFTSTTGATTLITIPAGKTWTGTVSVSAAAGEAAAATVAPTALGVISVAGTGVVPAAGNYFGVEALCGANAATGTVGDGSSNFGSLPMMVVAPVGNSVTVQVTVTIAGTAGRIDASAFGTTV